MRRWARGPPAGPVGVLGCASQVRTDRFRRLDPAPGPLALLRRRRVGDRGEPARAGARPAGERGEGPARAQGVLDVDLAPLVARYLPAPARAACTRRGSGARRSAARSIPSRPPIRERDLREILEISDHVVFNSFAQWERFQPLVRAARERRPRLGSVCASTRSARRAPSPSTIRARLSRGSASRARSSEAASTASAGCTSTRSASRTSRRSSAPSRRSRRSSASSFPVWNGSTSAAGITSRVPTTRWTTWSACCATSATSTGSQLYLEPGEAIALDAGVLVAEVLDLPWNGMPLADPRHLRHLPHAGRDRDALPPADHRRRRARRGRRTLTASAARPASPAT